MDDFNDNDGGLFSSDKVPVKHVLDKYIRKDRLSSYTEKFLDVAQELFNLVGKIDIDEEDYIELLTLLEENNRLDDRKKVNLIINDILTCAEDLKNFIFIFEKILLNILNDGVNITNTSSVKFDRDKTNKSESSEKGYLEEYDKDNFERFSSDPTSEDFDDGQET